MLVLTVEKMVYNGSLVYKVFGGVVLCEVMCAQIRMVWRVFEVKVEDFSVGVYKGASCDAR
jgi:hypothetical protein